MNASKFAILLEYDNLLTSYFSFLISHENTEHILNIFHWKHFIKQKVIYFWRVHTYSLLLICGEERERRGTLRHLLLGDFAIEVLAATHNLHFLHLFKFKSYLSIHHQFTCLFIFGNGFFFGRIMMREKRDGTYS